MKASGPKEPMPLNEKVWTAMTAAVFFGGLLALGVCSEQADASIAEDVKRGREEFGEVSREPLAAIEINEAGDVLIAHKGTWAISYTWGQDIPADLARTDPKCQRSFAQFASRLKRDQNMTLVCMPDDLIYRTVNGE